MDQRDVLCARVLMRVANSLPEGAPFGSHGPVSMMWLASTTASTAANVAQERLGHASAKMTHDIYAHVMPGAHEDVAQRIASRPGARSRIACRRPSEPRFRGHCGQTVGRPTVRLRKLTASDEITVYCKAT